MTTPVLLLHGLGGSPTTWDRVQPLLEGAGPLRAPSSPCAARIETEADALAAGLPPIPHLVVGHSRGGLVATALAERHPHLVAHLIVINTPPTTASRLTARSGGERLLALPALGSLAWAAMTPAVAAKGLATAFAPGTEVPDLFVRDLRATGRRGFLAATHAIDDYLSTRTLPDRLGSLDVTVDLVLGSLDQRVDHTSVLAQRDHHAPVTLIPEAGHTPIWERPAEVAAVINRTIRSLLTEDHS